MNVIMGATGHVGREVAEALLERGAPVTIVTRRSEEADGWRAKGAEVTAADADDAASLAAAFRRGTRAFLLNPPADTAGDVDAAERRTIANIVRAVSEARLAKVVAASTYGATPGPAIGDLGSLWELEQALQLQGTPSAINRGAYYMTNWTNLTEIVRETGVLPSLFPADTVMPMVAPRDLGRAAAERLLSDETDVGIRHVEGPARYTRQQVADAFAAALGRAVQVEVTPPERWEDMFRRQGFSEQAARSYAGMTATSLRQGFDPPDAPIRGMVTLDAFIAEAVGA
jgi:uncharacterized protein YbjT (DUF2867 family)